MSTLDLRACRDEDPELFHPLGEGRAFTEQIAEAKWICSLCPTKILNECLAQAVDRCESGIWGGTTASERRVIRRDRARAAALEATPTATKYCKGCERTKTLPEFSESSITEDGLTLRCTACNEAQQAQRARKRRRRAVSA